MKRPTYWPSGPIQYLIMVGALAIVTVARAVHRLTDWPDRRWQAIEAARRAYMADPADTITCHDRADPAVKSRG